jgi:hypothetical protein
MSLGLGAATRTDMPPRTPSGTCTLICVPPTSATKKSPATRPAGTTTSYISVAAAFYSADVSLASDVANAYINIRNYEGLIQVAKNNLAFQAESLRIARSRFDNGSTSLLDLSQSESQYQQTKSQIPTLIASLKMAQYTMSILLG